jgi:hypothetical protein
MSKKLFALLSARYDLGQNSEGRQTRRSPRGTAEEIRVRHQSQSRQADRLDDSAERVGEGGQSDSMKQFWIFDFRFWITEKNKCKENCEFREASKGRAEAVLLLAGGVLSSQRREIVEFAVKSRLPAIYSGREMWKTAG